MSVDDAAVLVFFVVVAWSAEEEGSPQASWGGGIGGFRCRRAPGVAFDAAAAGEPAEALLDDGDGLAAEEEEGTGRLAPAPTDCRRGGGLPFTL